MLLPALLVCVLLSSCTTTDTSHGLPASNPAAAAGSTTKHPNPHQVTAQALSSSKPTSMATTSAAPTALPPPPLTPEVAELVVHLTDTDETDILAHNLVDTTGFPEALASLAPNARAPKVEEIDTRLQPPPRGLTADGNSIGLIERDWTGLVLVPINKSLSKAYTSAVRLLKVEAHPLNDGRIRVWIRMQNIGSRQLPSEIACAFSMRDDMQPVSANFYELEVPSREYRDVFFVSPAGELTTYTVLIRSDQMSYRVSSR